MNWIVNPNPQASGGEITPEGCWFDFCGAFCGMQNCHKQDCPSHVCGLYFYGIETPI